MKRIICSSKLLAITLERFLVGIPSYEHDEDILINVTGKTLSINLDHTMDIESQEYGTFKYSFQQLKRLKKVLKKIPEQPITVAFNDEKIIIEQIHF